MANRLLVTDRKVVLENPKRVATSIMFVMDCAANLTLPFIVLVSVLKEKENGIDLPTIIALARKKLKEIFCVSALDI